jgi:hypothetical protein
MAVKTFKPIVRKARLDIQGYSPEAMLRIANKLNTSIANRMDRAEDNYDTTAPPLTDRYKEWKKKKYGSDIRDLKKTGRTRRGMRVLTASTNKATLGFSDPVAGFRVRLNQRISRMYGVSPRNREELAKAVFAEYDRPVIIKTSVA